MTELFAASNNQYSGTVRTLRAGTRFTPSRAPLPELNEPGYPGLKILSVSHLGLKNLPKPAVQGLAELLDEVPELLSGLLQQLQAPPASSDSSTASLFQEKSASSPRTTCASSYGFSNSHANAAAQWGIRTQEWGSAGYNQLVFDDNDASGNQQRIQLKTSQYASELNLGHLIHTADNYRGSLRGQGFELRSDAYGAVRAGAGLMFTTYAIQHNARQRDPAGDNSAALALLKQATLLSQAFSQAASTHAAVRLASHEGSIQPNASTIDEQAAPLAALLKASATQVSSQSLDAAYADAPQKSGKPGASTVPHPGAPTLSLVGQGGLALVAGQSLQLTNGETVSLMSGQDSQSITGGQLRIHSGQAIGVLGGAVGPGEENKGLTLIAAQDPIRYEAQSDAINIQAKGLINLQSTNSNIDFAAAKSISLSTAAGANITIEGGNITVQCPGKLTVHASAKKFDGPTSMGYALPQLPAGKFICIECLLKALRAGSALASV
jgi:type VI secretion system secreted protein VgrG